MIAIILAAGKGIRMQPLSLTKPKPLLKINNKSVLEHNLEQLNGLVNEVILVIGYKGEMIKNLIGDKFKNIKIRYVWQKKHLGTGDAAKKAMPYIKDRFILMNGDDLYEKNDIKNCLKKFPSILLAKSKNPESFGVAITSENYVENLAEKPKSPTSNLVNTGFYFLDKSIFNFKIKKSKRGEYEFTDYIKKLIRKEKLYFGLAKNWIPLSCSHNLLDANEFLLKKIKKKILGKVEKNCEIKGDVIIEKGTIIKNGSYIEGPVYIGKNCEIGPNCHIRGATSINDNCHISQAVEIKNSIIGSNSKICHLSYVGDSIIGEYCNLGGGTIVANLRHDRETIKVIIKKKKVDTGKRKFGTVLGDKVKTGIGTLIYPGRKIWPQKTTLPGEIVKEDIL
ncbi:MAG TPA: glucose-1-phosphate thymidylyltransferase [bacterium]|nr:glucose-1-phosphate thymidylyltransferase [bacterium]